MISKKFKAGVTYKNEQILKATHGRIFERTRSGKVIGSMTGLDQKGMFQSLHCPVPSVESETNQALKGFLGNTINEKRRFNRAYLDYDDLGNLGCIGKYTKIHPDIRPDQALKKKKSCRNPLE